jgi:hypothetical protein
LPFDTVRRIDVEVLGREGHCRLQRLMFLRLFYLLLLGLT